MKLKLDENLTLTITRSKLESILHQLGFGLVEKGYDPTRRQAPHLNQPIRFKGNILTVRDALTVLIDDYPDSEFTSAEFMDTIRPHALLFDLISNPVTLGKYLTALSKKDPTPISRIVRTGKYFFVKTSDS